MDLLCRIWAVFLVAAKRILSQPWLTLATALGLVTAVALIMSIPMYADAVYYRLLREELSVRYVTGVVGPASAIQRMSNRPPFAFTFRYTGMLHGSLEWEEVEPVDTYLSGPAAGDLRLPKELIVRHFRTDNFRLFPHKDSSAYDDARQQLTMVNFAFVSDLEAHVTMLEGSFPAVASPSPDSALNGVVEVMVGEPLALELGLQVGEVYAALPRQITARQPVTPIPVRIAGVWKARDSEEAFWFYDPTALENLFLVPEETFRNRISPCVSNEVHLGLWYLVMDGADIHASDVPALIRRITAVQQQASALQINTELDRSIVEALQKYQRAARLLTVMLYAFSVPVVGLLLAFISLVVGLSVGERRNEIAMLRSRGAAAAQVVGIAALEGLVLGAVALAVGTPAGTLIARTIGQARSFLNFTLQTHLRVGMTMATLGFGVAGVGLALAAQVAPTLDAARHTVVTYRQERARMLRPPWWQRVWLDVLLVAPMAYGLYLLRQQGSIVPPGVDEGLVSDPFQNPFLFLMPAVSTFALTLLFVRLMPVVMTGIGWVSSHTDSVGLLLASRYLARTPGFYIAPLVLLVLTLSLSVFTASMAQTLDHHLHERMYYQMGADMRLVELGESGNAEETGGALGPGVSSAGSAEGPRWLFLPVSEHLRVPSVRAAARVGRYKAFTRLSGGMQVGTFVGVDRTDFPQVAFWRQDFAPDSLGTLMNALAVTPEGVLLPRSFMAQHALIVGDFVRVTVDTYAQQNELELRIAGSFDLFPTWYPEAFVEQGTPALDEMEEERPAGPLFVGNLDHLFEEAGGQFPYDVWLATEPDVDHEEIVRGVQAMRIRVEDWEAPLTEISKEQQRPERQGLFGLLSVGFLTTAVLAALGFLFYAFFSFRRRFIELGVLRAVGLSANQMTVSLAWELAFLILAGVALGTGLGVWISKLFIPYLQVGVGPAAHTPPFIVEIPWPTIYRIYALLGLLFAAAMGGLTMLLLRIKIFQAVKLGETV